MCVCMRASSHNATIRLCDTFSTGFTLVYSYELRVYCFCYYYCISLHHRYKLYCYYYSYLWIEIAQYNDWLQAGRPDFDFFTLPLPDTHPLSYPLDTRGSSSAGKPTAAWRHHPPLYSAEIKNVWNESYTPTYTSSRCKARRQLCKVIIIAIIISLILSSSAR